MLNSLHDLTLARIGEILADWGYGRFHAVSIWRYLYLDKVRAMNEMADLKPDLMSHLRAAFSLSTPKQVEAWTSPIDGTKKYLLQMSDGLAVETVAMRYPGRTTVCVSSQVGCAMGCVFCATGQMGFARNLTAGEIVAQVLHVMRDDETNVRNVVLMGMGEPLHNFDAVIEALDILTDDHGLAIGPRKITVSTVGLPEPIRRLAKEGPPVNLAVSLHTANDEKRTKMVPVNKRWGLRELIEACREYARLRQRRIFFEWALIADQNDSDADAHELGQLIQGLDAHINLIPLNPTEGYSGLPGKHSAARQFQAILLEYDLPSTVRRRKGIEIDAGCGQLHSRYFAERAQKV